jgi:hypothetical protein
MTPRLHMSTAWMTTQVTQHDMRPGHNHTKGVKGDMTGRTNSKGGHGMET